VRVIQEPFRREGRKKERAWAHEIDDGARSDGFEIFDERAGVAAISRRSVYALRRVIIEFLVPGTDHVSTTRVGVPALKRLDTGRNPP
jgi:hypothetical protein